MAELLLEIGCEEIPARFVPEALAQLEQKAKEIFEKERISFQGIRAMGTPRRLALAVSELAPAQPAKMVEKWGPSQSQAYDEKGNPTKAILGFARSVGAEVSDLEVRDSDKGPRLYYKIEQKGRGTKEILQKILPELILGIRFPKSMRWGEGKIRFARPIHWILALFNGEVIEFEIDGIKAGNKTCGHRFLSPAEILVKDFAQYQADLRKQFVIVDPDERKKMIEKGLLEKSAELGCELFPDPELVEEVNYLVEYPVVLAGEFEPRFLELPAEVLVAAMRGHQRYFSLKEKGTELKLSPHFLFAANTKTPDDKVVIKGNEKVLVARLADAEFFYKEDLKVPLEKRAERLDQMVFQAGLGTYQDKSERLAQLIKELLAQVCPKDQEIQKLASRAVKLCKADLLTQMVGEFPELEGIMAGEYSKAQAEPEMVWKAVRDHYLPKTANDIEQGRFPQTILGQALSVTDKIDSIVAGFIAGNPPTGSADPYGIRRMANALIFITLEFGLEFNLDELMEKSLGLFSVPAKKMDAKKLRESLKEFFITRMKNILLDAGIDYDIVDAVLGAWEGSILSARKRAAALNELRKEPGFDDLFVGFRRVARIIEETGKLNTDLFESEEEKALWRAFLAVKKDAEKLIEEKNWKEAMRALGTLKPKIDKFFDTVLVNVEDKKIRLNRHSLLDQIAREFRKIADFSRLSGADKKFQGG